MWETLTMIVSLLVMVIMGGAGLILSPAETNSEAVIESSIIEDSTQEEMEYARIWLQFGPNTAVEELYVEVIPAGSLINPLDEAGSLTYPKDVVQLSGPRLIDGAVTYSNNDDGTINIYNVPKRWEDPSTYNNNSEIMLEVTQNILDTVETESVNLGDASEVTNLAERIIYIR